MATTRPDPDKLADVVAVDDHARKLVGRKAAKDRARYEQLTDQPLSVRDTAMAAVGMVLALAVLVAIVVLLLRY